MDKTNQSSTSPPGSTQEHALIDDAGALLGDQRIALFVFAYLAKKARVQAFARILWILGLAGAQQSSDSKRERSDEVNFVVVRQA